MSEDLLKTGKDNPGNTENGGEERFESDSQKIIHRHLENENDIITEEDIRSVRIGMTGPLDAPTEQAIEDAEEKAKDRGQVDEDDDLLPGSQQISPWDVLDPGPK